MARQGKNARRERHILELLRSDDPRAVKNGFQDAYEYLRGRPRTTRRYAEELRRETSRHLSTQDPLILPWIYSLLGVLRDPQYAPYLRSQLEHHDFDPVNRTWAVASLANTVDDYRSVLQEINEDNLLSYRLAAAMWRRAEHSPQAVRSASGVDDRLAQMWVCLLFSEGRPDIPTAQVRELTASPDAEVAQYALFALHKRRGEGVESAAIGPQDLMKVQPRVRRWYFQLLLKDPSNLDRYSAQIQGWMEHENNSQAREGLAKGFASLVLPRAWVHELRTWTESETDPFVLDALSQIPQLRDISSRRTRRMGPIDGARRLTPAGGPPLAFGMESEGGVPAVSIFVVNVDKRDQSINISGGNVGNFQAPGSVNYGTIHQDVQQNQVVDGAAELITVMRQLVATLNRDGNLDAEAIASVEHATNELSDAVDVARSERSRLDRLKSGVRQAGAAITGLATLSADANQLVTEADKIIHMIPT